MGRPVDFEWLSERVMHPVQGDRLIGLTADQRRRFRATELMRCPECDGLGEVDGGYDWEIEWEEAGWTCGTCGTTGSVAAQTPIIDWPQGPVVEVLGADPEGVVRAEAAARTAVERLVSWGVPGTDRIVWRVGGPLSDPMRATMAHPQAEVLRRLFFIEWRVEIARIRGSGIGQRDQASAFMERAAWHLKLDLAWRVAAERGLIVPLSVGRASVAGRAIADLANPFASLVDVWSAGYAFADIVEDAIFLIAPETGTGQK